MVWPIQPIFEENILINNIDNRWRVELTVIVDVSGKADIRFSQHYMIRPERLMIHYTYAPANDHSDRPYYHRTISVHGRYVLKSKLGADMHHVNFYKDADTPAWILEAEAANRPDWTQLHLPGVGWPVL